MLCERWLRGGVAAAVSLVAMGCANPGPVRPPSLNLPKIAADVTAERWGSQVRLAWTVPTTTTDGLLLPGAQRSHSFNTKQRAHTGALAAEICREEPGANACKAVARVTVQAGDHAQWEENLRADLLRGGPAVMRYRVRILNASGRDAGWSAPAAVATGTGPAAMTELKVQPVRRGVRLTWARSADSPGDAIRIVRESVLSGRGSDKSQEQAVAQSDGLRPAPNVPERIELSVDAAKDPGGAVDTAAKMGNSYRYTAYRERTVPQGDSSRKIHGEPATVTSAVLADTFAPAAPTGLEAIAIPADGARKAAIDLAWDPVMEADLAGYAVYRADEVGAWTRISPKPVPATAYHDDSVAPGRRYRYRTTAVDQAGNESAPSNVAMETVPETTQ